MGANLEHWGIFTISFKIGLLLEIHGRRQWGAGRAMPPWIFKHGTNIVDSSGVTDGRGGGEQMPPLEAQMSAPF